VGARGSGESGSASDETRIPVGDASASSLPGCQAASKGHRANVEPRSMNLAPINLPKTFRNVDDDAFQTTDR